MTKQTFRIILSLAFLMIVSGNTNTVFAQRRIARTVSPSMVMRVLRFQNITPQDLHNLRTLYESTGWKILKMDDDPSDGEMAVWGGRNMELSFDEFAVTGVDKPNNGIYIHMSKTDGFKVDAVRIVFNDDNEAGTFKNILPRYGINSTSDDEYEGTIKLKDGQEVDISCEFGYEGMNPNVKIEVTR